MIEYWYYKVHEANLHNQMKLDTYSQMWRLLSTPQSPHSPGSMYDVCGSTFVTWGLFHHGTTDCLVSVWAEQVTEPHSVDAHTADKRQSNIRSHLHDRCEWLFRSVSLISCHQPLTWCLHTPTRRSSGMNPGVDSPGAGWLITAALSVKMEVVKRAEQTGSSTRFL